MVSLQRSLTVTEDQLRAKVGEVIQLEQMQHRLNIELTNLQDHITRYDSETASLHQTIGRPSPCQWTANGLVGVTLKIGKSD